MMVRLVAVAAAGVLVLAGCGGGESPAVQDTPAAVTAATTPAPVASTPVASTPVVDGHSVMSVAQVIDAFQKAKLPVRSPRDNSDNCEDLQLGCIQLTTTDDISVTSFATPAEAEAFAAASGSETYSSGNVVLGYAAARTPAALRPKYERVLAGLK
jgi:hypothetical protein